MCRVMLLHNMHAEHNAYNGQCGIPSSSATSSSEVTKVSRRRSVVVPGVFDDVDDGMADGSIVGDLLDDLMVGPLVDLTRGALAFFGRRIRTL